MRLLLPAVTDTSNITAVSQRERYAMHNVTFDDTISAGMQSCVGCAKVLNSSVSMQTHFINSSPSLPCTRCLVPAVLCDGNQNHRVPVEFM